MNTLGDDEEFTICGETVEEIQRSLLLLQCLKEVVDQSTLDKAYDLFQERV